MEDILLSVDIGSSQTKVIYQLRKEKLNGFLLMPPEIEEVSKSKLDDFFEYRGWVGNPNPENNLWVTWNERTVVLGEFASFFYPQDRLKEVKYENALWKVMGAIGLILSKSKIKIRSHKPLKLSLGVLLPWNEYSDRHRFKEQLETMLSEFEVCSSVIKVNLTKFLCRPEGGGLIAARVKNLGIDSFRSQKMAVLMFGHRNTTALYFDRGQLTFGDSPLLGFSNMLDIVISRTSGLNKRHLTRAIFQAHSESLEFPNPSNSRNIYCPVWAQCNSIKQLATAKDLNLRTKEIRDINNAIVTASSEYWYSLKCWLNQVFNTRLLDEVIIGGGASLHIAPELEFYFNSQFYFENQSINDPQISIKTLIWHAGIQERFVTAFHLQNEIPSMVTRLLDCFGMFEYLLGIN